MAPTPSRSAARIREVRPAERPALFGLQDALPEPSPRLLSGALQGVGTVLASVDADDRPVGYLLAVPGREAAHVAEVVVAPAHRREGRASALLSTLCERLDGRIRTVRLAVAPGNDAARRCYREAGFRAVDRDPSYFEGGPAVVMERRLDAGPG